MTILLQKVYFRSYSTTKIPHENPSWNLGRIPRLCARKLRTMLWCVWLGQGSRWGVYSALLVPCLLQLVLWLKPFYAPVSFRWRRKLNEVPKATEIIIAAERVSWSAVSFQAGFDMQLTTCSDDRP